MQSRVLNSMQIASKSSLHGTKDSGKILLLAFVLGAKNFLCENAEVSTTLSPTDLCQQIFSDSEEMQDEFLSLVQEEQIPDEIKIENHLQ
ncbi:MAG: hypothetical protein ACLU38_05160 [Dysosmobacter sp.]